MNRIRPALWPLVLAAVLTAASFALQGRIGLDLVDEGFLWYGTWRTSLGEVPIRDFQAYDPGRYYWGVLWSPLFGDGLLALRASTAIFQFVGLSFGLLVLRRLSANPAFLFAAGMLLLVWMFPRHKLFEPSIAMAAVYLAVRLIERPSPGRYFVAGVFVGLTAFFGKNHGAYTLFAFSLLIAFGWLRERAQLPQRLAAWAGGVLLGASPLLGMLCFVPGFFESFVEGIAERLLQLGGTNIAVPIPWPWRVWGADQARLDVLGTLASGRFVLGLFYLIWPAFIGVVGFLLLRKRGAVTPAGAVLAAATIVSVPYLHHAVARAGSWHLAQAIHPLLIGLIALPFVVAPARRALAPVVLTLIGLLSFPVAVRASGLYHRLALPQGALVWTEIRGDRLLVQRHLPPVIDTLERIVSDRMAPGDELLIAPHWPMAYAILGRRSPLHESFLFMPASPERQRQMISELESAGVNWVVLGLVGFDRRRDLWFDKTHTLVWDHFREEFESVPIEGLPPNYLLLKRKPG